MIYRKKECNFWKYFNLHYNAFNSNKIQKTNTNVNVSFFFSFIINVTYVRIEKDIHFKYKYQDKGWQIVRHKCNFMAFMIYNQFIAWLFFELRHER